MFYNVENLFDTKDDPTTNDEEFTPEGDRHWTANRLKRKLLNISKVILNANGWKTPDIVALSEIENRYVLEKLLSETPLKNIPYKIIHKQSPDHRGIDVALFYNSNSFTPVFYDYFPLKMANDSLLKTREIVFVEGVLNKTDTLDILVNHWPSRYSGLMRTRELRNLAAEHLHKITNRLLQKNPKKKIIIVGDFNDQPFDKSISKIVNAEPEKVKPSGNHLYNLSMKWANKNKGTIKYQNQWMVFDQIIVSGNVILQYTKRGNSVKAQIVELPFLFEPDEKYGGKKLNRTYIGYKYHGGFSDHLPVLLQITTN